MPALDDQELFRNDPILRLKACALRGEVTAVSAKKVTFRAATQAGIANPELLHGVLSQCAELLGKRSSATVELDLTKLKFGETLKLCEALAQKLGEAGVQLKQYAATEKKSTRQVEHLEAELRRAEMALSKQEDVTEAALRKQLVAVMKEAATSEAAP
jgi:hypothetical protein